MSARIDKSWVVLSSIENAEHDRCVDLFRRPDGSFGFEEFRRDVEDAGSWTPVAYYSGRAYASKAAALDAAIKVVAWLAGALKSSSGGNVAKVKANGIEVEYEATGNSDDPALLLVMGLGAQLTIWPDALFVGLAKRGFYVIRYDNRDTGLSTDFGSWGTPNIHAALQKVMKGEKVSAPYYLKDMAADAVGLLDALSIKKANMVGASMGGMIVQIAAAQYPQRTRSMVSIYSTSGRPGLPQGKPEAVAMLGTQPNAEDREARVRHGMKLRQTIGSPGYPTPEADLRALVEKNVDRRYYPEGANRQYLSVI